MKRQNKKISNVNVVDFKADRKFTTAPEIENSYIGEDGEVWFNLKNGNSISEANYRKNWDAPKTTILDRKFKGLNPNYRRNWDK